jgi:hypothetical protein
MRLKRGLKKGPNRDLKTSHITSFRIGLKYRHERALKIGPKRGRRKEVLRQPLRHVLREVNKIVLLIRTFDSKVAP